MKNNDAWKNEGKTKLKILIILLLVITFATVGFFQIIWVNSNNNEIQNKNSVPDGHHYHILLSEKSLIGTK